MIQKTLLVGALAIAAITSSRANLGDTYEESCMKFLGKPDFTIDLDHGEGKAFAWVHNETEVILATFNDPDGRCDLIEYRYFEPAVMSEYTVQSFLKSNATDKLTEVPSKGYRSWTGSHRSATLTDFKTGQSQGSILKIVTNKTH